MLEAGKCICLDDICYARDKVDLYFENWRSFVL